jgi:glyoxylase-like metal-dependent hydrolase (beta-lactamase superfamily II)
MAKPFASAADTTSQKPRVVELADGVFGYISDFDPNTGGLQGEDDCLAIDCRATPSLAREMLGAIHEHSGLPVTRIFLTHYHAVRVLGRAAFQDVHTILSSRGTWDLIRERGDADFASEVRRFPRLFQGVEDVPGLTHPHQTFEREATLWMGREVQLLHLGRGHTAGDSVVWLPHEKILFAGDLIEDKCALYCGDAYLRDWLVTLEQLESLGAETVVPGRGDVIVGAAQVQQAITHTRTFLQTLIGLTEEMIAAEADLKATFDHVYSHMTPTYGTWPIYEHCIPFNVSRAFDEISGISDPTIWTAARDQEMWNALQQS